MIKRLCHFSAAHFVNRHFSLKKVNFKYINTSYNERRVRGTIFQSSEMPGGETFSAYVVIVLILMAAILFAA